MSAENLAVYAIQKATYNYTWVLAKLFMLSVNMNAITNEKNEEFVIIFYYHEKINF